MARYIFQGAVFGIIQSAAACLDYNVFVMVQQGALWALLYSVFAAMIGGFIMAFHAQDRQTQCDYFPVVLCAGYASMLATVGVCRGWEASLIFAPAAALLWGVGSYPCYRYYLNSAPVS